MYEGIPVLHVGQHGLQGPHIQVSCLSQGEASADGPVIHSPLQAVTQTLQDKGIVNQILPNQAGAVYLDGCQAHKTRFM